MSILANPRALAMATDAGPVAPEYLDAAGREVLHELQQLKDHYRRLGAMVDGAKLMDHIIGILIPVLDLPEPTYGIDEAAKLVGYSPEHLRRKVRAGELPNHGGEHIRVRLSECPRRRRTAPVVMPRRRAA